MNPERLDLMTELLELQAQAREEEKRVFGDYAISVEARDIYQIAAWIEEQKIANFRTGEEEPIYHFIDFLKY